jgi:hypothetical protein
MAISSNLPNSNIESTPNYFKNYFVKQGIVSDNQYESLIGLLMKRNGNRAASENLAAAAIRGAAQQNMTMTDMIEYIRRTNDVELDAFLAFFLNNTRVGTSYLGISNAQNQNPFVIRTILV